MSSSHDASPSDSFAKRALVCIPTYNERDNIEAITRAVLAADERVDVLVVDDNSPDGTGKLADELALTQPRIRVLHRPEKRGLGKAYLHAFREALSLGYGFVVEMDADFSHDPGRLPALIDEAQRGTHLVLGSRYVPGGGTVNWKLGRRLLSRGGSLYARTILGVDVADLTGGFKCFRREVLESIDLESIDSTGYAFQIEMTYRALMKGFSVKELPIVFEDRRVGQSKMSRTIFLEAVVVVWRLRLFG
ncbi:MAG: polyprenol monophosphomannose synthase [Polyangiaceae bacterium]|nr:polyprenol monophosphomannose synthase [Polyangiaceae bacterium]